MMRRERKDLRGILLCEIYDFHFENKGAEFPIKDNAEKSEENHLAYKYLKDSGYIEINVKTEEDGAVITDIGAKITVRGIDRVEGK